MDKRLGGINKKGKGQAAMDFLMSYGWAILVVLVAMGSMAYFGVLSSDGFVPRKCDLERGIVCIVGVDVNVGSGV